MIAAEERRAIAANGPTSAITAPDGHKVPVTQIKADRDATTLGVLSRVRNAVKNFLRPAQRRSLANAVNPYREAKA